MKTKIIFVFFTFFIISLFYDAIDNPQAAGEQNTAYGYTIRAQAKLTDRQLEFLTQHFDFVLVKGEIGKQVVEKVRNFAKSANKKIVIVAYTNAMFDFVFKPTDENAYTHNAQGKRVKETHYAQGWSLLNLRSQEWRQFFVEKSRQKIDRQGFDGIFIDDMGMASGLSKIKRIDSPPGYGSGSGWRAFSDEEWYQAGYDFLDYVKKELGKNVVIFNGLYHQPPQYDITFLEVTDGGMREGFILTGRYDRFLSEKAWKKLLNQAIKDINKYNKKFIAACRMQKEGATVEDRMFCFTSYLLINKPGHVFYSPPKCPFGVRGAKAVEMFKKMIFEVVYFPEMEVDLGAPLEDAGSINEYYDSANKVYKRKYSNGLVVVNPSSQPRKLSLDGAYCLVIPLGGGVVKQDGTYPGKIDYKQVSEVTIPAQSGIILLISKSILS